MIKSKKDEKRVSTELLFILLKNELQLFLFDFKQHMETYLNIVSEVFAVNRRNENNKGTLRILYMRLCSIHDSYCTFMKEKGYEQGTYSPLKSSVCTQLDRFIRNSVGVRSSTSYS